MALARTGLDVVSIDPDSREQELAALLAKEEGLAGRIRFLCGDAASLPFPEDHFGCAALMDVLHHLDDAPSVLEEIARVMKSRGIMILADFSKQGFEMLDRIHREEGREHIKSGATLESAQEVLRTNGFRLKKRASGFLHEIAVLVKDAGMPVVNEKVIST
jgi:ubiquinone/menaquinone biosynthesis C-methylase UbiE